MKYQHKMEQYHNFVELNLRIQCEKVEWSDDDDDDDEEEGQEAKLSFYAHNITHSRCVYSFFLELST